MHDQPNNAVNYPLLARPHIQLYGTVDEVMYAGFKDQLAAAPAEGPLVVSITTLGGDPEMARAMGDSIRLLRDYTVRDTLFLGKVAVYSAGATLMSVCGRPFGYKGVLERFLRAGSGASVCPAC